MHEGPVVVFSGGGTGGHLYPALAIADELRRARPDVRAFFFGARRGIEARVLPERGEDHLLLPVHGFDRSRTFGNWRAVVGLVVGLWRAVRTLRRLRPEVVVVTGGYAGAPAGVAAKLLGIPLVVQEQNSFPGATSRLLARWASRVHVAYPEAIARLAAPEGAAVVSGNPVREKSSGGDGVDARRSYGLPAAGTVVLVVGGSQGSAALNRVMVAMARAVARGTLDGPEGVHFLWATGRKHYPSVREALDEGGAPPWIHAVEYFDDMPSALAAADVAVSRSGAMSTAELLNHGLPAILVPLPTAAEDHQAHNARALAGAGAAVVVPEAELDAERLLAEVRELLATPDRVSAMAAAAAERARPEATRAIAEDVASFLPTREGS